MNGFAVHEVAADLVVRIGRTMPVLSPLVDQQVERLWQSACQRVEAGGAGKLFNGRVFSADSITPHLVTGHLTEYRRTIAQAERGELFAELGLRSFAVCGVLRCADGVVIGRRHRAAVYEAGMWQLPPAGSIDAGAVAEDGTVDPRRQLLVELEEELGIPPHEVDEPIPLCIVEHPGSHVSDLGFALVTKLSAAEVLEAQRSTGNTEYEQVVVVSEDRLAAFLAEVGEAGLVPSAREFLIRAGLTTRSRESSR